MIISTVKDNTDRAKRAVGFLWGLILVNIALMLSAAILLSNRIEGVAMGVYGLLTLLLFVMIVLSAIYFLRWLHRAYANLEKAGLATNYSHSWAVGAWFVPFISLIRPYTIMREIWRGTYLLAYEAMPPHTLLRWWWAAFLLNGVARYITSLMSTGYSPQQERYNLVMGILLSLPSLITAAFLTLTVVRRIAAAEEQLLLRQQVAAIGGPAPEPQSYYPDDETLAY